MPISGEAIRTMNYVDDIAVTFRRMLSTIPTLSDEDKVRVREYIEQSQPKIEDVLEALK